MAGKPRLLHIAEVIGVRVLSDSEATTIFAEDPIIVALPPKPAPNANAHQRGAVLIPELPSWRMTGISAIVIGMLSTIAERIATTQINMTPNKTGFRLAASSIT